MHITSNRIAGGLALATLLVPATALAGSAYDAGLHQARKRHIANPACYASVFQSFASLNRNGHWAVQRRRRSDNVFELEIFSRCGA